MVSRPVVDDMDKTSLGWLRRARLYERMLLHCPALTILRVHWGVSIISSRVHSMIVCVALILPMHRRAKPSALVLSEIGYVLSESSSVCESLLCF